MLILTSEIVRLHFRVLPTYINYIIRSSLLQLIICKTFGTNLHYYILCKYFIQVQVS